MKKVLSVLLIIAMLFVILAACGSTDSSSTGSTNAAAAAPGKTAKAEFTMRIGSISTPPTPEPVFITELESVIEEATGGRIDVEVYTSGTLGTTVQMITGLQDGSVQGVCVPINYYESYVPELGVLALPMLFKNADQGYRICRDPGKVHDLLDKYMESKGFVVGAWLTSADSCLISVKPINKFEELKGLKVWCSSNSTLVAEMKSFGCDPVNFDTGDLAVGLQQKTIDGAFTGTQLIAPQKLYESAGYILVPKEVSLGFNIQSLILSKIFVDSLPQDLRDILLKTIEQAGVDIHYKYAVPFAESTLKEILDAGTVPYYVDEDFAAKAKAATSNIAADFLAKTPSAQELYDAVVKQVEEDNAKSGN